MNSRKIRFLFTIVLFLALAVPSTTWCAESPADQDPTKVRNDAAFWSHLATMRKATELIGMTVMDRAGHTLGRIADLALDPTKGRVVCAMITPPGGDAISGYIPVPTPALFVAGPMVTFTADDVALADVPRLSPGVTDPAELGKAAVHSYAYFKLKFVRPDQESAAQLWKSTRLIGRKVKNKAGDNLGNLANLMLDLRSGHVFFGICSLDGTDKNVYAVPPSAMTVDRQEPTLLVDADRTKIASTSNADGFFWTSLIDPAWGANVYSTYSQTPNSEPAEGATAKVGETGTNPIPAGPSDSEVNNHVMTALARSGLSGSAYQNVMVMVSGGKVTLQGKVRNESTKQKVLAAAESAAPGKVNSLLVVGR